MTLDEFRKLEVTEGDQSAQLLFLSNVILGQNPRLTLGEPMISSHQWFYKGKMPPPPEPVDITNLDFNERSKGSPAKVQNVSFEVEWLSGHPFVDFDLEKENYLHPLSLTFITAFGSKIAGDFIEVTYNGHKFKTELTQQMIDESTKIVFRFGLSK